MPQVFLGVGHGITPQGTFDQGAQAPDRNEYEMNFQVVAAAAVALDRCGVSFFNEEAAGKGHDPDFVGSAHKANDLNVQLAIEVHHNASPPPHAGFGCEMVIHPQTSDSNMQLGRRIAALLHSELGLNVRHGDGLAPRDDLGFLNITNMPAMIPEISFVDNDTDRKISGRADYGTKAGEAIAQAVCEHFGKSFVPPHAAQPVAATGASTSKVSPSSALMAAPRGTVAQVTAYLLARPHGAYSQAEVQAIAADYFTVAGPLGLDPLIAASQMIEETAHLSSFWSQPPRHNMAGIGVTGEQGVGLSFPTATEGIRAQIGRLLAYALKPGTETPGQSSLIAEALSFRPLPDDRRGVAPTLAGLAGPGRWAADPQYADKIAWLANQITGAA
ncbi:MAG TPA: N-acetylmuramoyl-L-alanine amidase [Streptosporangiaceae bacterium]|nr:N-acetylmuramoyl-L-alanine amidase [Streptosporangiaceae bacterium]